ncbi:bifunctional DNA-binding transcriptional regulator/O6-methylguanine-DNA methyltransferase Ada [Lelliottia sp. F153]|uniref:bifunctional DNA-binding transcriptional regulator/O6-methylguanine-DNA methyltransferase Ada n=1 Tax=unclassified Lelliottia TaxID=2642424 RepID=UPI000C7F41C0|nr:MULTISPECIES: bifunctional DNA-binding transcriptional regulator/O6-methylguanine-DNA methyltransferase Ada [unclassified Lelliottia]PLY45064.1 bifunctional DNA-binding transcriptional regulator/O6-methylguanine-DNA methyltransferase Ada [Lelliottia sp. F159]PLY49978.1 bifunctional DNA-binding transcriptional regulator/O6-methylguanine-DNA methyltransferase Ada [Lelliottia sp. F154]PLY55668.1 bifunctional DNA-binding transcriptional regulator/O6-methylguanine-DNA methyltransferase Ada [Lellio
MKNVILNTDEERWLAVLARDSSADNQFVFAVQTTGIFCRPSCRARHALRKNVRFFPDARHAEQAGFRPCKRCAPDKADPQAAKMAKIEQACRLLEEDSALTLTALAEAVAMSPFHFHRLFKTHTGMTPKSWQQAARARRLRAALTQGDTITDSVLAAGFPDSSSYYRKADDVLGMTAKQYRNGGNDVTVRYAISDCDLGRCLVAESERGICAILLGDNDDALAEEIHTLFPHAQQETPEGTFAGRLHQVITSLDNSGTALALPLDIRGTAFQQQVWQALRAIPCGETASYQQVASAIGKPNAVRAVASACAANKLAIVIPCHRVVRNDGALSGYRWGTARKAQLLQREAKNQEE